MCGICGFNWCDGALLERMKSLIEHRGPDAHGSYLAEGVSLGHRRLSIVDLSESGRQPLSNEDGTVWITFNGEIYNSVELRRTLELKGHRFRGHSDTESIVHAYEEFGLDVVQHLVGMFAFAIWDGPRRRLMLARDRLGIKPLYYALDRGRLRFASEIKALLADPSVARAVNPQGLFDLIGYEFTPAPDTLFRGVQKLLPGCILVLEADGSSRVHRYWRLEQRAIDATPRGLATLLDQVCADHMMSDVPVGSFLSGGIDSSAVVQFVSKSLDTPLQTFALGYEEKSYSEFEYARRVADWFGTQHRELLITPIDSARIERSVWHLDEPTTDPSNLPFMLICQQAHQFVKVCLSGDGGDELFMGYDRFRASKACQLLERCPIPFRGALYRAVIDHIHDDAQKKGPRNILKRFLQGAVLPAAGEHIRWQYFLDPELATVLFKPEFLRSIDLDPFAPVKRWSADAPTERGAREQFIELNTVLPDSVLMKVDKMSMAHSLEVRPPLLDHRVVEYAYSLPTRLKLHGFTTKWLLKQTMQDRLPPGIAHRKKQGFSIPMKNWIRGELAEFTRDEVFSSGLIAEYFRRDSLERFWQEHQLRQHNHSHLFWTLLNLSLWDRLLLNAPAFDVATAAEGTAPRPRSATRATA
jgi:asparagine synthase (glutamine-hydrolysing)